MLLTGTALLHAAALLLRNSAFSANLDLLLYYARLHQTRMCIRKVIGFVAISIVINRNT